LTKRFDDKWLSIYIYSAKEASKVVVAAIVKFNPGQGYGLQMFWREFQQPIKS